MKRTRDCFSGILQKASVETLKKLKTKKNSQNNIKKTCETYEESRKKK